MPSHRLPGGTQGWVGQFEVLEPRYAFSVDTPFVPAIEIDGGPSEGKFLVQAIEIDGGPSGGKFLVPAIELDGGPSGGQAIPVNAPPALSIRNPSSDLALETTPPVAAVSQATSETIRATTETIRVRILTGGQVQMADGTEAAFVDLHPNEVVQLTGPATVTIEDQSGSHVALDRFGIDVAGTRILWDHRDFAASSLEVHGVTGTEVRAVDSPTLERYDFYVPVVLGASSSGFSSLRGKHLFFRASLDAEADLSLAGDIHLHGTLGQRVTPRQTTIWGNLELVNATMNLGFTGTIRGNIRLAATNVIHHSVSLYLYGDVDALTAETRNASLELEGGNVLIGSIGSAARLASVRMIGGIVGQEGKVIRILSHGEIDLSQAPLMTPQPVFLHSDSDEIRLNRGNLSSVEGTPASHASEQGASPTEAIPTVWAELSTDTPGIESSLAFYLSSLGLSDSSTEDPSTEVEDRLRQGALKI